MLWFHYITSKIGGSVNPEWKLSHGKEKSRLVNCDQAAKEEKRPKATKNEHAYLSRMVQPPIVKGKHNYFLLFYIHISTGYNDIRESWKDHMYYINIYITG